MSDTEPNWVNPSGDGRGPLFVSNPTGRVVHVAREMEDGILPCTTNVIMLCGHTVRFMECSEWRYITRFHDYLICQRCHKAARPHDGQLFKHPRPSAGATDCQW